jgi:peptide/nickel transport system permease protein
MSGPVPQPIEPGAASPVGPVAPIDRTGGYLGPTGAAAVVAASRATPTRWRLLLGKTMFWIGAIIVLFWVVCAVFGHAIAPYNPLAQQLLASNAAPSSAHWFGTDPLGRDVLSRVITGARDILIITPLATLLGTVLGTALGLAMGYFGGWFDTVTSRIVEAILALPFVIIAFVFVVAVGSSVVGITVIIGLVFTPLIARTVRTAVLVERHQDYVSASRLLGEGSARVMFGEILPNVLPAILVEFTVRLAYAVFAVATLSFLSFGIQPPTPDWGADITANYSGLLAGYWWQTLFAALALATLVTAVALIADSIEQVLSQ